MRFRVFLAIAVAMPMLAACSQAEEQDAGEVTGGSLPPTEAAPATLVDEDGTEALVETLDATPMEERIATIGLLNKRNNVSRDFEIRPGETVEEGPVILTVSACERTAPYEFPQQTGAFVQVDVLERGESSHTRVFSGWLIKESPSINVLEHPIYDVWVKDCAMSFPGEE